MIVFCMKNEDTNLLKIIIGPETRAMSSVSGLVTMDLDEIIDILKSNPLNKNMLQVSFCENEDEVRKFLSENATIKRVIEGDRNGEIPPIQSKPRKVKCPTCSGDALIDSEGNIHPCESCLKIDAYKKGIEKGMQQAKPKRKRSTNKRKTTTKKNSILMEYDDNGKFEDDTSNMD